MDKILYYPYINLPQTDWTMRALLYYDSIGSIVPQEYEHSDERRRQLYEPFMRELIDNKLVIPINPIEVLDKPWEITDPLMDFIADNFKKTIEHVRETSSWQRAEKQLGFKAQVHKGKFSIAPTALARVHSQKFDSGIFYRLEEMGLARKGEGEWYYVQEQVAEYLMKFLASVIGAKLEMLPTTDKHRTRYWDRRQTLLKQLIPFPEEINIKKLRAFKEKHHTLLHSFKNKVEQIVLDENLVEGTPLFREKVKDLILRRDELSAKMNESKFGDIFYGTVCGIFGAYAGLLAAETFGAFVGGLPGFASAVHSALKIERAEDVFDQSGLKYLALVDKRLRRNTKFTIKKK